MKSKQTHHDPAIGGGDILHEVDIGSGEKTPAERETDEMIKQIPPLGSQPPPAPPASGTTDKPGA